MINDKEERTEQKEQLEEEIHNELLTERRLKIITSSQELFL